MITKITAANDQEYYAPRFAHINKRLQDVYGDQAPVIDSLEAYFGNIEMIGALEPEDREEAGYLLLVAPADEEYFEIDANARTIAVPALFKKYGVGVFGDHQAEMLVFKVDKYFDYQNLYDRNIKIAVNWNFTPVGSRVPSYEEAQHEQAVFVNDVLEPGYITFGFPVTKDMTPSKGILTFSVTFYELTNDEFVYSLNTQTVSVNINDSLPLDNAVEIKNRASSLLSRLQNSVYTPDGVPPLATPIWLTGDVDSEGKFLGLENEVNFEMGENGVEPTSIKLVAQAYSEGHVGTMKYKWYANEDDISYVNNGLVGVIKKLTTVANDSNKEKSEANQAAIEVRQLGDEITIFGDLEMLQGYRSTNPGQADQDYKWIGFDIETRADTIESVSWSGYQLTAEDVAESASIGLAANHIVFWAKAEQLAAEPRTIVLSAPDFDDVTLTFKFVEDDEEPASPDDYILAFTTDVNNEGSEFEEGHVYYIKDELGAFVAEPLTTQAAIAGLPDGTEVYELKSSFEVFGAGRYQVKAQATKTVSKAAGTFIVNSEMVESNVCVIPSAAKPAVALEVESSLESDFEIEDNSFGYIYIDANSAPVVKATVISTENDKPLGAIALQMVKADQNGEIAELSKEEIETGNFAFTTVGASSYEEDVNSTAAVEEGEYRVRAINYKNHTYSVSEPSETVKTSFVAPAITKIDVTTVYHDEVVKVIENSNSNPIPNSGESYRNLNYDVGEESFTFNIENNTPANENYDGAVVVFVVEEVLLKDGEFVPKADQPGNTPDGAWDKLEVILDNDGHYTFTIAQDTGYYRIKIINKYNGTVRTTETGVFRISQ